MIRLNKQSGSLHLPMALCLIAVVSIGFGTWAFLRRWRYLAELQLHLDRCVGNITLKLRDTLTDIESTNRMIGKLRLAIAASSLLPEGRVTLQTALTALAAKQDMAIIYWESLRIHWSLNSACGKKGGISWPPPSLDLTRPPPDVLGQQKLYWQRGIPNVFFIQAYRSPRAAAATVEYFKTGTSATRWVAAWTIPQKTMWANIY
ncbi:MAG: hypothetical protein AABZ06_07285 [Bdellovibrionota bacterium]